MRIKDIPENNRQRERFEPESVHQKLNIYKESCYLISWPQKIMSA